MSEPKQTSLHETHTRLGARMVEFAGWSMPLSYVSQLDEHHAVRRDAGIFDVSHMTIVDLTGSDAAPYLGWLLANDVAKLSSPGQALYSCMLREDGGILDDLIVYRLGNEEFRLIVNAATREKDLEWLNQRAAGHSVRIIERTELAMMAVQGPAAREAMAQSVAGGEALLSLSPFTARQLDDYFVARTGYTGEDGFEIILPAEGAPALWATLTARGVVPCGLGARDTLRLEAGLNLYGSDMDESVSPLVCGLRWTVGLEPGREFIGRRALEAQLAAGLTTRQAGLMLEGRGVLRGGYPVITTAGEGVITSGTFSPTLNRAIALARLPSEAGEKCEVLIRGGARVARIVKPPFVRHGKVKVKGLNGGLPRRSTDE